MVHKINILESDKLKSWRPRLKYFIGATVLILLIIAVVLVVILNKSPDEPETKSPNGTDDDLIFAQTICRHGDRNSYEPYPNDAWKAVENWPEGYAQLTKIGKQQNYALGQYLRRRYAKLLGNGDYSADKVLIYSTDTDRTLMSAQACLASLFVPQGHQIWNPKLNWQPVPVHTVPRHEDHLVAPEKPCDRYEYEMIQYTNSSEYRSFFEENRALIKYLEEKSGAPLNSLTKLNFLYDTLLIEKLNGKSIPAWAEEVMRPGSAFEHLALVYFTIFAKTDEMKKLRSGYLLGEILERSKQKSMSTLSPDRSLSMFFGHDNALADMLISLGLYELHIPPFTSCLFFELYKPINSTENYLQIFYRNSTDTNVPALEIPNCGSLKCPLTKWFELYKNILPTKSYDEECQLGIGESLPPNENPEHFFL